MLPKPKFNLPGLNMIITQPLEPVVKHTLNIMCLLSTSMLTHLFLSLAWQPPFPTLKEDSMHLSLNIQAPVPASTHTVGTVSLEYVDGFCFTWEVSTQPELEERKMMQTR